MFSELAGLLFYCKDYAHRAHLTTPVYSHHLVLDTFYKELTEQVDQLAEAYRGRHQDLVIAFVSEESDVTDYKNVIKNHLSLVEKLRNKVDQDSTLQSLIDNIVVLFLSTLNKLSLA
jgi:DNA-binding ferritin-like protein